MNTLLRSLALLSLLTATCFAGPIQLSLTSFAQTQGLGLVNGTINPGNEAVLALCIDRFNVTGVPSNNTGNLVPLDLNTTEGRALAFIYMALSTTLTDINVINYNPSLPNINPHGIALFQYAAWEVTNPATETYFANNLGPNQISSDSLTLLNAVVARVAPMNAGQFTQTYGSAAGLLSVFVPDDKASQRFLVNSSTQTPEPGTLFSVAGVFIVIGLLRRRQQS